MHPFSDRTLTKRALSGVVGAVLAESVVKTRLNHRIFLLVTAEEARVTVLYLHFLTKLTALQFALVGNRGTHLENGSIFERLVM